MIVILTYYSDGSGTPGLTFFPIGTHQTEEIAFFMATVIDESNAVQVWLVEDLEMNPMLLYPANTLIDNSWKNDLPWEPE